jgi:solute:Na+ symporter, SSS family
MLIFAVVAYMAVTILIGLLAARHVSSAKDFLVAGRSLPLYINFATVFATWFGAETVLSVSATFAKDGLRGIPADPFGAACCLVLVALFFARAFYRMDLLTIGDFYKKRYGKSMEVITSLAITISYLGWTSAQLTALGLVILVLSQGAITLSTAIMVGAAIVLIYTVWGGMWSIALTDLLQTVVILVGLVLVAWLMADMAGGADKVIDAARQSGKFEFWPTGKSGMTGDWMAFIGAFLTLALGSIPQQDVFQRVTSAKDEKTAVQGTLLGGTLYFFFAFVPMFIAMAAIVIDPKFTELFKAEDAREVQRILPDLILAKAPLWAQIMFFGALLSAILSTASGALLAPTALFTENVLRPFMARMNDKKFLLLLRSVLVMFTAAALIFALNSRSTMYEMVQNAYKVTLVGALVPLAFGLFWRKANSQGALLSVFTGLIVWLASEAEYIVWPLASEVAANNHMPAQINGLIAAIFAMILGSLIPVLIKQTPIHSKANAAR